jgi:predicted RNA polymerase sigma factor
LALEYRNLERLEDAFKTFEALRAAQPDYVPMYLMCGGLLEKLGRKPDAREWYEQGIAQAKKKGDGHALSELQGALAQVAEA